jgi:hypothetical protein
VCFSNAGWNPKLSLQLSHLYKMLSGCPSGTDWVLVVGVITGETWGLLTLGLWALLVKCFCNFDVLLQILSQWQQWLFRDF